MSKNENPPQKMSGTLYSFYDTKQAQITWKRLFFKCLRICFCNLHKYCVYLRQYCVYLRQYCVYLRQYCVYLLQYCVYLRPGNTQLYSSLQQCLIPPPSAPSPSPLNKGDVIEG